MAKTKRTKKYNPHKTDTMVVEHLIRSSQLGVLYISNTNCCDLVHIPSKKIYTNTQRICNALTSCNLDWHVINALFLKESNGKEKAIYEELSVPNRCRQHQIVSSLNEHHGRLIREQVNKGLGKNILNIGWLATPYELDLDENIDELDVLFSTFGAYKNPIVFVDNLLDEEAA